MLQAATAEVRLDPGKSARFSGSVPSTAGFMVSCSQQMRFARGGQKRDPGCETPGIWRMSVKVDLST
jgi:hypothetical protein